MAVFLITGGSSGIVFELQVDPKRKPARQSRTSRQQYPQEESLEFLKLELDDLSSMKESNNAGGIELQLATNCLGPFLFTQLLKPLLQAAVTETATPPGSVRVVWTASQTVELSAPPQGHIMSELHNPPKDITQNYTNSKTINLFLAFKYVLKVGSTHNIISVAHNPRDASINLLRDTLLASLFTGVSKEITLQNNGCYVLPWGRLSDNLREDLGNAMRPTEERDSGRANKFWQFCEEKTLDHS
ncbi:NAD(P)-binding protein [Biscogniauxia sp. FL1348]|nr:NAD(P)-binding protein [Biscogniauxia sp. FL1348]